MDNDDLYIYLVFLYIGTLCGLTIILPIIIDGENIKTIFYNEIRTMINTKEFRTVITVFPYILLICESLYLSYSLYAGEG